MTGSCDKKLRVYNTLSWKEICVFDHDLQTLKSEDYPLDFMLFEEAETKEGTVYEGKPLPYKVPQTISGPQQHSSIGKIDTTRKGLPRVGISLLAASHDGRYIASKCEA